MIEPHYPKAGNGRQPLGLEIVIALAVVGLIVTGSSVWSLVWGNRRRPRRASQDRS